MASDHTPKSARTGAKRPPARAPSSIKRPPSSSSNNLSHPKTSPHMPILAAPNRVHRRAPLRTANVLSGSRILNARPAMPVPTSHYAMKSLAMMMENRKNLIRADTVARQASLPAAKNGGATLEASASPRRTPITNRADFASSYGRSINSARRGAGSGPSGQLAQSANVTQRNGVTNGGLGSPLQYPKGATRRAGGNGVPGSRSPSANVSIGAGADPHRTGHNMTYGRSQQGAKVPLKRTVEQETNQCITPPSRRRSVPPPSTGTAHATTAAERTVSASRHLQATLGSPSVTPHPQAKKFSNPQFPITKNTATTAAKADTSINNDVKSKVAIGGKQPKAVGDKKSRAGSIAAVPTVTIGRRRRVVVDEDDEEDDYEDPRPRASSYKDGGRPHKRLRTVSPSIPSSSDSYPDSDLDLDSTVETKTHYVIPKELEGVRKALGQSAWDEYIDLVEQFVAGAISVRELEIKAGNILQVQDSSVRRQIGGLMEKVVRDGR